MSEQNCTDTRIEDGAKKILSGDTLKNALDFIAFMRASGFKTDDEYGNNFYYMSEPTCVFLCFDCAEHYAFCEVFLEEREYDHYGNYC